MLGEFIAAGFSEDVFWSLTPRQVQAHFAAARLRAAREHNARVEQAYLAAAIPMMKKPPTLKSLLVEVDAPAARRQTGEEAKAVMRQIFASRKSKGNTDGRQ